MNVDIVSFFLFKHLLYYSQLQAPWLFDAVLCVLHIAHKMQQQPKKRIDCLTWLLFMCTSKLMHFLWITLASEKCWLIVVQLWFLLNTVYLSNNKRIFLLESTKTMFTDCCTNDLACQILLFFSARHCHYHPKQT